jgi:hypothetical protein
MPLILMSRCALNKRLDEIISSDVSECEAIYESGSVMLDEIIPKIEAVLPKPYAISKEESEVIFPGELGRCNEPGVFLYLKYDGKDIRKEDKGVIRDFRTMGYKIAPVIESINQFYGFPVIINMMRHTFH